MSESKHTPGHCPDKAANGGVCPHHNLHCAWPKCEPQTSAPDLAAEVEALKRQKDGAYEERNRVVAALARAAVSLGWKVAVTRTAIEGWSEDWHGCIYIETPAGQVSWHFHDSHAYLFADLPLGEVAWDGHTTPEKYERLHGMRLAAEVERLRADLERERMRLTACDVVVHADTPESAVAEEVAK